jgi:cytochrome c oxidase assembly factor CtaG
MSTPGKAAALFCVGYLAWYVPWLFHGLASGTVSLDVLLPLHLGAVAAMFLLELVVYIDISKRPFNGNLKMTWTAVIFLAPLIGAVVYLFFNGFRPRESQAEV